MFFWDTVYITHIQKQGQSRFMYRIITNGPKTVDIYCSFINSCITYNMLSQLRLKYSCFVPERLMTQVRQLSLSVGMTLHLSIITAISMNQINHCFMRLRYKIRQSSVNDTEIK